MTEASNNTKDMERAKKFACKLLTYRPRSEFEVCDRLKQKGFDQDVICLVITWLKEYRYINDYEFASQWVAYRQLNKPMGRQGLKYELRQKGIGDDIIEQVLVGLDFEEELNLALAMAEKKLLRLSVDEAGDISEKEWGKVIGLMQRRGFSAETIRQARRQLAGHRANLDS